MKALYIASTGMAAQERNVEIISNNISNMRTTGYKRQRAEFQDLLYQQYLRAGTQTSDQGTQAPVGIVTYSADNAVAPDRIYGNGRCVDGYVWREAYPGDHVCVTQETRARTAIQNDRAPYRRAYD